MRQWTMYYFQQRAGYRNVSFEHVPHLRTRNSCLNLLGHIKWTRILPSCGLHNSDRLKVEISDQRIYHVLPLEESSPRGSNADLQSQQ